MKNSHLLGDVSATRDNEERIEGLTHRASLAADKCSFIDLTILDVYE